jgi:hypothetical protein
MFTLVQVTSRFLNLPFMTRIFILRGKFGTWCFFYGVSVMDPCETKTLLSAGYLLMLTEKFAVDLGSILRWGKPTLRCL